MDSARNNLERDVTPMRRAVDWLIKEGKIEQDSDLVELFDLSKSTISGYINYSPGKNFKARFERHFGISLEMFDDFHQNELANYKSTDMNTHDDTTANKKKPEETYMETISDLSKIGVNLSETNKDLSAAQKDTALANRILAENQRELIEILKRNQVPIANGAKETPKVFLSEATLDLMAARGILQGLWKSKDEGRTKLDILVGEAQSIKQE